jgi:hypothetical protein
MDDGFGYISIRTLWIKKNNTDTFGSGSATLVFEKVGSSSKVRDWITSPLSVTRVGVNVPRAHLKCCKEVHGVGVW